MFNASSFSLKPDVFEVDLIMSELSFKIWKTLNASSFSLKPDVFEVDSNVSEVSFKVWER